MRAAILGYTLIELLVVIFIISIVTSVALLSIHRNENRTLEAVAKELTQSITLAEEQAMLQPVVLGLVLGPHAYQFFSYQPPGPDGAPAHWLPFADNVLKSRPVTNEVELAVEVGGKVASDHEQEGPVMPQIVISTNGDVAPFKIYISKTGKPPRYLIQGEDNGNITTKLLS